MAMKAPPSPIGIYTDEEGVDWVVIICPYCQADLGKVSMGRTVMNLALGRELYDVWHPIRCPDCNHPLLPVPKQSPVQPARRPLTS